MFYVTKKRLKRFLKWRIINIRNEWIRTWLHLLITNRWYPNSSKKNKNYENYLINFARRFY